MTDTNVTEIGMQAMLLALKLGGPILITALSIGIFVGVIQSATQLQEPTITFVPKFVGIGIVLLLAGNWMLAEAIGFTQELFAMIPGLLS